MGKSPCARLGVTEFVRRLPRLKLPRWWLTPRVQMPQMGFELRISSRRQPCTGRHTKLTPLEVTARTKAACGHDVNAAELNTSDQYNPRGRELARKVRPPPERRKLSHHPLVTYLVTGILKDGHQQGTGGAGSRQRVHFAGVLGRTGTLRAMACGLPDSPSNAVVFLRDLDRSRRQSRIRPAYAGRRLRCSQCWADFLFIPRHYRSTVERVRERSTTGRASILK